MNVPLNSASTGLPLQPTIPQPSPNPLPARPAIAQMVPTGIDPTGIVRFLYCHNPFYCLSALLVLWGLAKSFHFHGAVPCSELLMSGLAGYALLLAAVGCLLIHAGQLWQDIRTILLLIVIIFLASSMSFDEVLAADQAHAQWYYIGGLAFAVMLSELVLRGVRLRLPMLYRLPYYATLALFFLYPLLLAPWRRDEFDPQLLLRIAGFTPLAGLVTLTLLPAVRRGASYVRNNGSPWQWPWFPWPLFVVLAVGVALRSYTLCVSFQPCKGPATIFEPYFLVPLLLAVNALLLEVGIIARRQWLLHATMAAPLAIMFTTSWTLEGGPDSISVQSLLLATCGCSALFLTLLAVTILYAVALLRRVPHAIHWFTAALAMFVVIGPSSENLLSPTTPQAWPLVMLAVMQLDAAISTRRSLHWLLTGACTVAAVCVHWPEALVVRWHGAIPEHLMLASSLLVGAMLNDRMARALQKLAFAGLVCMVVSILTGLAEVWWAARSELVMADAGCLCLAGIGYGYWVGNHKYRSIALGLLAAWSVTISRRGYGTLRSTVAGLDQIALGMACLLTGLLLSLWKIGMPQAWWKAWLGSRAKID